MTLLTTDEYRALHPSALEDEALQLLLDAAEADIVDFTGSDDGAVVEWLVGGRQVVVLGRRAASISSVVEDPRWGSSTTLATNDYEIDPTGFLLYRKTGGDHSRYYWASGRVIVTYAAADSEAQRKVVQADLVYLVETYAPNLTSTTIGSWTEQYRQATRDHLAERDQILARLTTRGRMLVVGG